MTFTLWIFHIVWDMTGISVGGREAAKIKGRSADEFVYEFLHAWLEAVCNTGETQKANLLHYGCGKNSQRPKDHGSWTPLRFDTAKKNEAQNTTATSCGKGHNTYTHTHMVNTSQTCQAPLGFVPKLTFFALLLIMLTMRLSHCIHSLPHSFILL